MPLYPTMTEAQQDSVIGALRETFAGIVARNGGCRAGAVKVLFRADASTALGAGHVMRCLALADALKARGAGCTFICAPVKGNLLELIESRGHAAQALGPPQGAQPAADWTVDADLSRTCAREPEVRTGSWSIITAWGPSGERSSSILWWGKFSRSTTSAGRNSCDALLDQNLETAVHERQPRAANGGRTLIARPHVRAVAAGIRGASAAIVGAAIRNFGADSGFHGRKRP